MAEDFLNHRLHRLAALKPRSEVERARQRRVFPGLGQAGTQQEISAQAVQYVLPGPDGGRVADGDWLAGKQGPDGVGHQAILGIVAPANDIASARAGHLAELGIGTKERLAPAMSHQLGGGLAHRIDIVPSQWVRLAVAIIPAPILVALVGRNHEHRGWAFQPPHRFQKMGRAPGVDVEGLQRLAIRAPHQRLRRQVKDDVRTVPTDRRLERVHIPKITLGFRGKDLWRDDFVEGRLGGGFQPNPMHLGAQMPQPQRQPASFETGVARDQHSFARIEIVKDHGHQVFQGAWPADHSLLSSSCSR